MHTQGYIHFLNIVVHWQKMFGCLNIVYQKEMISSWFILLRIKCSTGISNEKYNWSAVLQITMSKIEFKFKQSEQQIKWSIKHFVTPVISHPFFSCTFPRKGSRVVLSVTWASSDENANRKPQTKSCFLFLFSITVASRFRFSPTAVSV